MTDRLLDMQGLADYLDVPFTWVRDKVTARAIPFTKVGKHVRFRPDHVKQIETKGDQPVEQVSPTAARPAKPVKPSKPPKPPKPRPSRPVSPPKRAGHLAAVPTDPGEVGSGEAASASPFSPGRRSA